MKILVLSCNKNEDLFYPFYHCMEKYWKEHEEVIYITETIKNPYYKTINVNTDINEWTYRIAKALKQIDDDKVLIMIDDNFIREQVDTERLKEALKLLNIENVASVNLEKSFDDEDIDLICSCEEYNLYQKSTFKARSINGKWKCSLMCSLWNKDKLITLLEQEKCDPWTFEENNNALDYIYLINGGDLIINWGYIETYKHCNLKLGKWCKEIVPFFEKENIEVDYEKRGFYD